jgi:hypothetical protein
MNKYRQREEERLKLEQARMKKEEALVETRTYTPVTRENYNKWFASYMKEIAKVDKETVAQSTRFSGREFYLNLKNQKLGGAEAFETDGDVEDIEDYKRNDDYLKEEKQDEDVYVFDKNAFKNANLDNLDDVDFDDEDD